MREKKQKRINVKDVIFVAVILLTCFFVFCLIKGNVPAIFGYRLLHVVSGSMEPMIESGSYIIIKEADVSTLCEGDIITFVSEESSIYGMYNTHRIYDICTDTYTGETLFITKGDAYTEPDIYPVKTEQVVGKLVKILPYGKTLNKIMTNLSNNYVYFGVVIVPLLICLASYFVQFMEAIFSKDDEEQEEKEELKKEELKKEETESDEKS